MLAAPLDMRWLPRPLVRSGSSLLRLALVAGFAAGCAAQTADAGEQTEEALSSAKLTPADVSILLPLPKRDANESLSATAKGKDGEELIPATAFVIKGAPTQKVLHEMFYRDHGDARVATADTERPLLRLTAVRVDPCGRVAPTSPASSCVPEVRLVFQPVLPNAAGTFEAADGAVHAFYRVSADELKAFTKAMFDARNASGGFAFTSLGVHPTLAREGLTGSFAKVLFAKIKGVCGGGNLERLTFLQRTSAREPVWVFGVASVTNKIAKVQTIASTTSKLQALEGPGFNSPMHFSDLSLPGGPTETGTDDKIGALLDTRTSSPAEQLRAVDASFRIDNPTIHSPETMSCVECHVASGARNSLLKKKPELRAQVAPGSVFDAPMTTRHAASKDVGNLHSFSWKGADIGISDRAANESARVAAEMNKLLF